jgi:indole-3-glycerol phosphate synthase
LILEQIVRYKTEELAQTKRRRSLADLKFEAADMPPTRDFAYALCPDGALADGIKIVAEIKQASPSCGVLRQPFDPVTIAGIYQQNGAAAISVLTEQRFFKGSLEYLAKVRRVVGLPLLRKDFIFDEYQLYEARVYGADAVLLIAGILSPKEMEDLSGIAREMLGLCPLIEVHSKAELEQVLRLDPNIVGINNRDLQTFKTDLRFTLQILADIPDDKIVVSESGIHTREDMLRLEQAGVAAALIGEELMRASDMGRRLKQLLGRE